MGSFVRYLHIAYIAEDRLPVAVSRSANRQWVLKPQDIVVAFKIALLQGAWKPYKELAADLSLSPFEAHAAVQRLVASRLAAPADNGVVTLIKAAFQPFIHYGAPYAYPAVRTEMTIGSLTAYGVPPLSERVLYSAENPPVWPHPEGSYRGIGLLPLYEKAPLAALADRGLYELLALFDGLRIGQAREKELAASLLAERLR